MSIRRFFSLSLRHWHGAASHQNAGSPRLNPLIVRFIIKTIVVAFLMVVVLAAGQNEATRRLFFFTAGGIDANQAQGNNCGVTKNPKEPSAGWRTSGGFSFSQGVPVVNLIRLAMGRESEDPVLDVRSVRLPFGLLVDLFRSRAAREA